MPSSDQILAQNDHSRSFKVVSLPFGIYPFVGRKQHQWADRNSEQFKIIFWAHTDRLDRLSDYWVNFSQSDSSINGEPSKSFLAERLKDRSPKGRHSNDSKGRRPNIQKAKPCPKAEYLKRRLQKFRKRREVSVRPFKCSAFCTWAFCS